MTDQWGPDSPGDIWPGMTPVDVSVQRIRDRAAKLAGQLKAVADTVEGIAAELNALLIERQAEEIDY